MRIIVVIALAALPLVALAQKPEKIKEAHREAAQKYLAPFSEGLYMEGTIDQNGSLGSFEAYFQGNEWYVSKTFGDLTYFGYLGESGHWLGSNVSLPYSLDAEDHPADIALDIISSGEYMEEPYWEYFQFISEDAGGYNFVFDMPDLPKVDLVLYSDPDEPHYLQLMRSEVPFSENDPVSLINRSYIYYEMLEDGRLASVRETGRHVDQDGETVNFTEYAVKNSHLLEERPAQLNFDPARKPVGDVANPIQEPVVVEVVTEPGYFMVPITFEGSDETHYFMLDTGASASVFTKEAAQAANISTSLSINAYGHGTRTKVNIGLCTTASVSTAESEMLAPLQGFAVTTIPETSEGLLGAMEMYGASGILGVSMLHQYVVTFDFRNSQIILYPPELFSEEEHLSRPNLELWLDVESLIFCTGTLNGKFKGDVVIDTGLQHELAILSETMDAAGIELETIDQSTHTVLGGVRKFDIVRVPLFEIGPLPLKKDLVATMTSDDRGDLSARGVLGFLGIALFRDARITIDLFAERMYIEDPANSGILPDFTEESGPDIEEDSAGLEDESAEAAQPDEDSSSRDG